MGLTPIAIMFALFLVNAPIAFAIAVSALSFFLLANGLPISTFTQKMAASTDPFRCWRCRSLSLLAPS